MLVKVWNLNVHPYEEKFRDRLILIPAGEYVEMDEDEADYFLQAFTYPKKDAQERPDPRYFKKLKIERLSRDTSEDHLICHATGGKAASEADLKAMLATFSHMLAGKDDEAEAEIKKQNSALKRENKDLKSRLDAIEARLGLTGAKVDDKAGV